MGGYHTGRRSTSLGRLARRYPSRAGGFAETQSTTTKQEKHMSNRRRKTIGRNKITAALDRRLKRGRAKAAAKNARRVWFDALSFLEGEAERQRNG